MWTPRSYVPGDEEQLAALFETVFGRPVTPEWWRWKLKGQPTPVENVWVGVSDDGRIIAQYAGIPVRIKLAGEYRLAMVSVDTMTAPDFRRKGILTNLGKLVYDSWAQAGICAVLGLPNEQWGSRTLALGWSHLFPLAWMRFPLHAEKALIKRPSSIVHRLSSTLLGAGCSVVYKARRALLARRGSGISVSRAEANLFKFDELWSSLASRHINLLVRDGAWIKWRYCDAPDADYKLLIARKANRSLGYIAYRLAGDPQHLTGMIADLFTAPADEDVASALLASALDDLWDSGAVTARTLASLGSPLCSLLHQAGFTPLRASFSFDIVPLDKSLDIAALSDPHRWHLAAGDFDVV